MKIDIVGNHCTWTKDLCTSFVINDNMLFDVPQGSFGTLKRDYNLEKIDYIIISHFHSDHFGDLFLFIENMNPAKSVTIIAPKMCKERLLAQLKIYSISHNAYRLDNVKFIDAENNKIINLEGYKIKCYSVCHEGLDAYGYVIDDGVKVGFSGDSCMCNNIRKIASKSRAMFIDASSIEENKKHLATYQIKELSQEFPQTTFYPVHLSIGSEKTLNNFGLITTKQGQQIIIN